MEIRSYLENLDKEKLIEILTELNENYPEVQNYFELKTDANRNVRTSDLHTNNHLILNISRSSSPAKKIALFKSLFIGREDVFALRWFNSKSNKSGYSPVCANKWQAGKCDLKKYNCSNCPFNLPVKLNDTYIYNHLASKDQFCRDVIGLYPLMQGNTCRFLAFDFDSHTGNSHQWKADVIAVQKKASEYDVKSYIEISRSGNGAHLWIFFSEDIPARMARNFGSVLLKASMLNCHSIPFESFDRMFPNQDEMPKGGYGNLIALPLQGRAVKEGHSVFVDGDFKIYEDQWMFLGNVQKINEKTLKKVTAELNSLIPDFDKNEEDYESETLPSKLNKTKDNQIIELSSGDFNTKVSITLSNSILISKKGISEKALGIMRRTSVFLNPEYFKNLRMHLPLYNIPRYIDCSKETDEYLLLPRGNLRQIIDLLNSVKVQYEIKDKRENGDEIEVTFNAKLYENQKDALKSLLKSENGILCAGTGFGKTVVSCALIAERKTNVMILVQTHSLLEQWKKSIKQFLNFEAGIISAGKDKSTGIIDIAIVNSLTEKNSDEVKTRSYKYGMLIVDECHHVSAFTTENLVSSFKAKYVYGLTATPIRRDGHQKIIFYQCGPVLYSTTTKQMNENQNFNHYFIPRFTSFHYQVENKDSPEPAINFYYEKMAENEARNLLIVSDIKGAVQGGRTPLVLSDRIEHLKKLQEKLKDSAQNVILITGKGTQKQKKEQLEKLNAVSQNESLVVLATGKYAGEGFDYPRLDTLMLAMPFSWKGMLQQYCGRLHRNFEGKSEVIIYDYVDYRIPSFDRMYQNRLKGYKQLGYSIREQTDLNTCSNQNSRILSYADHAAVFIKDVSDAKDRVIIMVPFLSRNEALKFSMMVEKIITNGIKITVLVRKHADDLKAKKQGIIVKILEDSGVIVYEKENISQNIAVIDEKILWYGSINFLGFSDLETCSMRIENPVIASEIEGEMLEY